MFENNFFDFKLLKLSIYYNVQIDEVYFNCLYITYFMLLTLQSNKDKYYSSKERLGYCKMDCVSNVERYRQNHKQSAGDPLWFFPLYVLSLISC